MIPLEINRPWIASNLGKKIVAVSILTLVVSFSILFTMNSFDQGTVNIQQINLNISGSFSEKYSVPYGRVTMNPGSQYTIKVPVYVPSSASLPVYIKSVSSGKPFTTTISGTSEINSHGTAYIEITVNTPSGNYAGPLNLTVTVS